ncbi:MAG: sugar transferase [Candidatus Melainabacteria bacterium]|nr:sugar transferase [Candidatus Melainabacteria bacterium]
MQNGIKPSTLGPVTFMFLKRLTDIFLATTALVGASPLLLGAALWIKLDSKGPVIFRQKRIGTNGELFEIYKFRTMREGTPDLATDQMQNLPSPITRSGNFLRKTSIDELPQLVNVLKGEMSLVGPRPALYNQTELTALRSDAGVLAFPPGITGWAQVNGRDELPDPVKVEFDKWYCDHWSYFLDWRIMFETVFAVVSRRGAK